MGRFVFITSVGMWIGMVASFTHLVVPVIRATLHTEAAFALMRRLFPRYYTLGLLCGLTGLAAISLSPGTPDLSVSRRLLLAFPLSLSILCTVFAQYYIHPRMGGWHAPDLNDRERMLRFSGLLNSTVLFMLVFAFATFATR